jgi:hypothetical protein
MSEIKLCKDCKHYRAPTCGIGFESYCQHPSLMEVSPVSGHQVFKNGWYESTPIYQRKKGACGKDGVLFEQSPEPDLPPSPMPNHYSIQPATQPVRAGFWSWFFG